MIIIQKYLKTQWQYIWPCTVPAGSNMPWLSHVYASCPQPPALHTCRVPRPQAEAQTLEVCSPPHQLPTAVSLWWLEVPDLPDFLACSNVSTSATLPVGWISYALLPQISPHLGVNSLLCITVFLEREGKKILGQHQISDLIISKNLSQ